MAEAFLSDLLRVENSVQPNSSERCIICLTECGTLCPETGIVEWEIRLPCHHVVGSRCIAKWLGPTEGANNRCPICRYVFFPAQPRPYLEHGITGDQGPHDLTSRYEGAIIGPFHLGRPNLPVYIPRTFDSVVREVEATEDMGRPGSPVYTPTDWEDVVLPNAPEHSPTHWGFEDIVWPNIPEQSPTHQGLERIHHNVIGAQSGDEDAYEEDNSEDIIPEPPAPTPGLRRSARLRAIAPEPPMQATTPRRSARQQNMAQRIETESHEEHIEEEEVVTVNVNHRNATDPQTVKGLCEAYCRRATYGSRTIDISQRFAQKIQVACLLVGHSLPSIAAVSVFVATLFTGFPRTPRSAAMMSGVDADVIKHLYRFVYHARVHAELFDEEMLALIDRGDLENVLEYLPQV